MPNERDIQEEQEFLDGAYEGLEAMRSEAAHMLRSVLDLGRGGTFQSRTERDIVVRTSMARMAQLDIGDQALCFGRIDLLAGPGHDSGESFHIGRLAVSGPDHEPLVVDWRAPVAEPFYRATGLDPRGLGRRRHLAVSNRRVTGVEDEYFVSPALVGAGPGGAPDGRDRTGEPATVGHDGAGGLVDESIELGGPGALLAALGRVRTGQMGDIVATIQREQDEIIRSPLSGALMVQGGPGTGKTAVALHRAAYLLYTHRFPLERQGVLVVGPNPLFLRYIEHVLPSLGETGVTLSTVAGLVPEIRVRAAERPGVARLKGEARMAKVIARAIRSRERPLRRDLEAAFGVTTLRLGARESEGIVAAARRRAGTHNGRRRFVEHRVLQHLVEQYEQAQRRAAGGGTNGATERMGNDELAELRAQIRRVPAVAEALDRMWPRLSPHELLHDLFGAPPLLRAAGKGVLGDEELSVLFRPRATSFDDVPWTLADAALVDEARSLLGPRRARQRADAKERAERGRDDPGSWPVGLRGAQGTAQDGRGPVPENEVRTFGHIVVDEAQDLSPMQLRMLSRRSISGSMTVVGDIAQATGPWAPGGWDEVATHISPARPARLVELTVGYRTPAEVMAVAAGVLAAAAPGLRAPRPVRSSGVAPSVHAAGAADLARRTAEVAAGEQVAVGTGRTAVLVPESLAPDVVAALVDRGLDPVDPRNPSSPGLAAPLVLLPAAESHGLEFDSVVVVEPALIASGDEGEVAPTRAGLRTLYVALTRPTRRLAIVHALELPVGLVPA